MAGWHHWLNGHEFEQASWVGDGQGRLACCSPWDHKESNMTEQLNWTELNNKPQLGVSQVVLVVKNLPATAGDVKDKGLILGSGRSPGGGHGYPLQYYYLENSMDRRAWCIAHRVAKSWVTRDWAAGAAGGWRKSTESLHCCCSVAQSCPTLRPHGVQHTRLPCPSPSPRVCSNSCLLSW